MGWVSGLMYSIKFVLDSKERRTTSPDGYRNLHYRLVDEATFPTFDIMACMVESAHFNAPTVLDGIVYPV